MFMFLDTYIMKSLTCNDYQYLSSKAQMMVKFAETVIYHHFYSIHSSREKYFQHHKLDELLTNTIKVYKGRRRVMGVSPFHFQSENLYKLR